jgi:hypothetical protein
VTFVATSPRRYPVPYSKLTEVHLIHIREGPALTGALLDKEQQEFGWDEIEKIVSPHLRLLYCAWLY